MTLIEVLLAISILGVCLALLLTAASRCLSVLKAARNYQTAIWTLGAGEAAHPLKATAKIEDLKVSAETFDNGCTYERDIEDDEDEDDLYVVRTKVTWLDRGKEMTEEVVRYLHYVNDESGGTATPTPATPPTGQPTTQPPAQPQNPPVRGLPAGPALIQPPGARPMTPPGPMTPPPGASGTGDA